LLILDRMLVGGLKFVLGKVAAAADAELNDEGRLREELLAAQMRLELGELAAEDFAAFEAGVLARLREIRERQRAFAGGSGEMKVTGVEATVDLGKE
jgi:gas vesicle protein GvpG